MTQPWIHHSGIWPNSQYKCAGVMSTPQMLVDNCYAFSLLLQHSTLKEKFFGEGAPRGDARGLSREYVLRIPSVS